MKERYATLAELTNDAPLTIADNVITDIRCHDWFREGVYPTDEFGSVKLQSLLPALPVIESSLYWWRHPAVYTAMKMQEEMQLFLEILAKKFSYLVRNTRRIELSENESCRTQRAPVRARGKETLQKIIHLHGEIMQHARKKVVEPRSVIKFALLEDLVTYVATRTTAKQCFGNESREARERRQDLYVDEQLVATVLYASLIARHPVVFVTNDSDPIRMLSCLHALFYNGNALKKWELDLLSQAPIHAYFIEATGPCLKYDSAWPVHRLDIPLSTSGYMCSTGMRTYAKEKLDAVRRLRNTIKDEIFPYGAYPISDAHTAISRSAAAGESER